jgi:hypothetical protein
LWSEFNFSSVQGIKPKPYFICFQYHWLKKARLYDDFLVSRYLQLLIIYTRSRDSDWLRAERPRGRSSSPGSVKHSVYSTASRPATGPTQPPVQWVPGVKLPGREADHSPHHLVPKLRMVELCKHSPICLHDVVLN